MAGTAPAPESSTSDWAQQPGTLQGLPIDVALRVLRLAQTPLGTQFRLSQRFLSNLLCSGSKNLTCWVKLSDPSSVTCAMKRIAWLASQHSASPPAPYVRLILSAGNDDGGRDVDEKTLTEAAIGILAGPQRAIHRLVVNFRNSLLPSHLACIQRWEGLVSVTIADCASQVAELDGGFLSQLAALRALCLTGWPALGAVRGFPTGLEELSVVQCDALRSLDVSHLASLHFLNCHSNKLTGLDLTGCSHLARLFCFGNEISAIRASKLSRLREAELWPQGVQVRAGRWPRH
jgi:Leucine-rich repeat (LRR) protein